MVMLRRILVRANRKHSRHVILYVLVKTVRTVRLQANKTYSVLRDAMSLAERAPQQKAEAIADVGIQRLKERHGPSA